MTVISNGVNEIVTGCVYCPQMAEEIQYLNSFIFALNSNV